MKKATFLAAALITNSLEIQNPPNWLKTNAINRVAARIENKLEWSPKRISARFYATENAFVAAHGYPQSPILAFYRSSTKEIHFGPRVTVENIEKVLAHEMAHAVLAQKYSTRLPKWLEEGLANWAAKNDGVKWRVLAQSKNRLDPRSIHHPIKAADFTDTQLQYQVSMAFVHFLQRKCPSFRELLNLSLKSKLEAFLPTYCGIHDAQKEFWAFVDRQSR